MTVEQSTGACLVPAGPIDAPALAGLARTIWREAFATMISREQIEYMLETIQSVPAMVRQMDEGMDYYFICDDERRRVGYAAVRHERDTATSHLSKLYILAAQRNGAIAGSALRDIMNMSAAAGSRTVSLTVNKGNARAIRFYEKHGFATERAVVMDIGGGFVMDDYVMTRTLPAERAQ